jgi:hypothetical protein
MEIVLEQFSQHSSKKLLNNWQIKQKKSIKTQTCISMYQQNQLLDL